MGKKVTINGSNLLNNLSEDWGGINNSQAPIDIHGTIVPARAEWGINRGEVERFIKEQFNGKSGDFYYDADTSKYLIFADADSRALYLSDRETYASLLLGTFDAPANYTAEITMATPVINVVLNGTTGNYIDFTFDVKSRSGSSTGEAVIVTYTFNNSGNVQKVTQVYAAGTSVHFLIDQYLAAGSNSVSVVVTGRNTLASSMAAVNFTVVALELTSDFDFSQPVSVGEYLSIPYTLSGAGVKYLEWYIDGVLQQEVDTITDLKVNRTKNIDTTGMSLGKHSVQARAYFTSDGTNYYGATLYFDYVVRPSEAWGGNVTYVLLALILPAPAVSTISVNATQYEELAYKVAVYDSRSRSLVLTIYDNGTQIQSVSMHSDEIQNLIYIPTTTGNHILTFTCDGQTASITTYVESSDISINEVTTDLLLKLSAKERSNTEVNPAQWTYGNITTTFNNFAWNEQSGWNDGALVIPAGASIDINFAPLGGNPITKGRTIEIDYETSNIDNDDASVISLVNSGTNAGLDITASTAKLQSSGGANVNTKYKDGDRVHLAFIINKTTGDNGRLIFIVNNGILERAASFAATDVFQVGDNLHIGSAGCTVKIHSIRIYDKALTIDEAFCNYAIDSDNLVEIANNNDILNESTGLIDADKVNAKVPIMIITGDMQPIFDTTDKNTTVYVDMEYRNLQDQSKNFTATHVRMRPQGTSSLGYPRKNLRPYTASKYGCTMYDANGNVIENGLYAFKDGSQPVNCWTLKADYAESSGSHNTGVARIWNDLMYNCQLNGEFPLRTNAQNAAIQAGYNYDVRTTVDGFPIVVFYRQTANSPLVCLGQYNFNNDKSTEKVFGFTDIPGFDNTNVQCFEFLANENPICLFDDISNFDTKWDEAFESRYPDTSTPNLTPLKTLATWINSCKDNQSKWESEKAEHFDLPKLAAYYVYLMRFGAVDQTVKNAMITTEDGVHWFFINYDNDTILGIDNISTVLNAWNYDRTTQKVGGAYYYAGHNSVLWNCFEADDECMELVKEIDNALYSAGLTYGNMVQMFDHEQCDKWCERIYNDNGAYKYIQPFKEKGSAVLYMLQGSRKSYRRWWLQHRFDLYDAMWATGAFRSRIIRFIAEGAQGGTFTITSAADTFFGYGINSVIQEAGVAVAKNATHDFTIEQTLAIGDPVAIYNANNISKVDLGDFAAKLTTLYINQAVGNDGRSCLKSLILGDGVTDNVVFTEIGGLNAIRGLEEIDIRNFKAITNVDLTALPSLHIFKAADSGLTSFVPATGATLTNVSLPATIQSIALNGANVAALAYTPTTTLRSLSLRNVSGTWDAKTFVNTWLALLSDEQLANVELTLTGINWTGMTTEQVLKLGAVGVKDLRGKVTLSQITPEDYDAIVEVFGENIFSPNSQFIIDAPTGIYLTGPTALLSGEQGQFVATAFPVSENAPLYYLYDSSETQITSNSTDENGFYYYTGSGTAMIKLYRDSGIVTVGSGLSLDVTLKIKVKINNTLTWSDFATLQCQKLVMPIVAISGEERIYEIGSYDFSFSLGTYNAELQRMEVTFSAPNNVATVCLSGNKVVMNVLNIQGKNTYTLRISAICKQGTVYNEKSIVITDSDAIMNSTSNPEVLAICYAQGWCANADKMTATEALTVTDIGMVFRGKDIRHFEELQYFKNVTRVGDYAFRKCSSLTSITIPDSVTSIGDHAFQGCTGLTSINVLPDNTKYDSRNNCNAIIETVSNKLIIGFKNTVIPNSVTTIGDYAFLDCTGLTSITIPDSVTSIGYCAFNGCTGLTSVTIGSGVTSIGECAFQSCTGLTSITIPDSVTRIGNYAFNGCTGLTSITIPDSVTRIENYAFNGCTGLTSVTIGSGVTSIGGYAFQGCTGLTSITIPDSVTSIGGYAFNNCTGLTSITIPDSVTSIGGSAFFGCTGLTSVTIGSGVTSIGECAFQSCTGLTSITIPDSVTRIENYAFNGCTGLTSITIPHSVTIIGIGTFSSCTGLTSVTIGSGVTSIGDYAFLDCSKVETIICLCSTAPLVQSGTFGAAARYTGKDVTGTKTLYVPAGATGYDQSYWADPLQALDKCNFVLSATL